MLVPPPGRNAGNRATTERTLMKKYLIIATLLLAACSSTPKQPAHRTAANHNADYSALIMQAENQASGRVKAVLAQARIMTLLRGEIIKGGCWDYLDAAWTRVGVPRNQRKVVFAGNRNGHFASPDQLRAGDWIYHINHSYRGIEHSGMFIGWVDKERRLGLTLSYAGERRHEPARYKVYDLSSGYQITRAE